MTENGSSRGQLASAPSVGRAIARQPWRKSAPTEKRTNSLSGGIKSAPDADAMSAAPHSGPHRAPRVLTHRKTIVYTRQDCTDRESLPRQRTAACRSADDRALRTIRALRASLGASVEPCEMRNERSRCDRRCHDPAPRTWPARRQQAPRRRLGRACRIIHLSVLRTRSRSSVSGRSR